MSAATSRQADTDLKWVKSSYSAGDGGECVEVAAYPDSVHVRDSKDKAGPHLALSPQVWSAFVEFAAQD